MSFYTSPEYLKAVAQIYFRGRDTSIQDVRIGDDVLRLLVVDNRHVVTSAPFLDYHQPLPQPGSGTARREFSYAKPVVRRIVEISEWEPAAFEGF